MQSTVRYPSLGQALPSHSLSLSLAHTAAAASVNRLVRAGLKEFGFVSGWDFSLRKFLIYSHVNFPLWHLRDLIVLARYYFVTLKNNYRVCLCLFFHISFHHSSSFCFFFSLFQPFCLSVFVSLCLAVDL